MKGGAEGRRVKEGRKGWRGEGGESEGEGRGGRGGREEGEGWAGPESGRWPRAPGGSADEGRARRCGR